MKIRVTSEFYDKFHTGTLYKVGTVLDFDDERSQDIISKKLAVPYEEPEKKAAEPKAEQPKVDALEPKAEAVEVEKKKPGRPAKAVAESKTDDKEKAE